MVVKKYGAPTDYSCAKRAIYGALHEVAKRERLNRIVRVDKDGNPRRRIKSKNIQEPYLVTPNNSSALPGKWIVYYDEVENTKDEFVSKFARNKLISEDPTFLDSLKQLKVSWIFHVLILNVKHSLLSFFLYRVQLNSYKYILLRNQNHNIPL